MTLVQEISRFLDIDEKTVAHNITKVGLRELVQLIEYMKTGDKESAFKIISGVAV